MLNKLLFNQNGGVSDNIKYGAGGAAVGMILAIVILLLLIKYVDFFKSQVCDKEEEETKE